MSTNPGIQAGLHFPVHKSCGAGPLDTWKYEGKQFRILEARGGCFKLDPSGNHTRNMDALS